MVIVVLPSSWFNLKSISYITSTNHNSCWLPIVENKNKKIVHSFSFKCKQSFCKYIHKEIKCDHLDPVPSVQRAYYSKHTASYNFNTIRFKCAMTRWTLNEVEFIESRREWKKKKTLHLIDRFLLYMSVLFKLHFLCSFQLHSLLFYSNNEKVI